LYSIEPAEKGRITLLFVKGNVMHGFWSGKFSSIAGKSFKFTVVAMLVMMGVGCAQPIITPTVERLSSIPTDVVRILPETDPNPPKVFSDEYESPVPIPGKVNTAGGEDSDFITTDGKTLYFFFTPDMHIPVETQILDGTTGLYVSQLVDGAWQTPKRIILQDPGKLSLDGCYFVQNNIMWFCTTREGLTGLHWFTAEFVDGKWQNWQIADFDPAYEVGELAFSKDGSVVYFHSARPGGMGGLDIWKSVKINGAWQEPVNVSTVNTAADEGWPALSPDDSELWFSRNYGIWRSRQVNGKWQEPELIISPLAGEPSIDAAGNVYFIHHFLVNGQIYESDIYVAYKKQ
jgi:hypothetical protein